MNFFYKKRILIISPEPWGINHVSKHHYATTLALNGSEVFFLNPPGNNFFGKTTISPVQGVHNLQLVDYNIFFRGINRMPQFLRNILNKAVAKRIGKVWGNTLDIVWSFDPFRFQKLDHFGARIKIYHAVDVHQTPLENTIASSAHVIFATSAKIMERLNLVDRPKYKIGHGLSEHFASTGKLKMLSGTSKIKVGYIGNLHYRFLAKPVLTKIIQNYPQVDFFFIGPYQKSNLSIEESNSEFIQFLQSSKNVHLLGQLPTQELSQYMASFDLFLLAYTGDKHVAELANPHKILEYLSTGKVIVSSYIDEYNDKRHLIEMTDVTDELPKRFGDVVKNLQVHNSPEKMELRRQYAYSNTYLRQLKRIEALISGL